MEKIKLEEKMKKIVFTVIAIAGILLLAGCPTPIDPTPTDNCDENIQLSSSYNDKATSFNLSVDLPISFMVEKIIATPTTNTTIQSTHSKINEEQKMIIVGDGEELKGKIHITSEYIPENILYTYTPLVSENELKENLGSNYEEYKNMFLKKDESFDSQIKNTKKTQQDVSVQFFL